MILYAVRFFSYGNEEVPAGGWMVCDQCDYHATWSVPDEVAGFDVKATLPSWEEFLEFLG